ncbi:hypothetical protein GW17_00047415 [Ensete ventricosum]|nr:hypothetical protein GW17_00047415 [Ensete ventricosum]
MRPGGGGSAALREVAYGAHGLFGAPRFFVPSSSDSFAEKVERLRKHNALSKIRRFGYQTYFGDLPDRDTRADNNVLIHGMPVCTNVSAMKKNREKRKGQWRNRGGRKKKKQWRKKKEEEEIRGGEAAAAYLGNRAVTASTRQQ